MSLNVLYKGITIACDKPSEAFELVRIINGDDIRAIADQGRETARRLIMEQLEHRVKDLERQLHDAGQKPVSEALTPEMRDELDTTA